MRLGALARGSAGAAGPLLRCRRDGARAPRIAAARNLQLDRAQPGEETLNARLEGRALERIAAPDEAGRALLVKAAEGGALSARGWTRTLRLARTIADLEGSNALRRIHIAEALIYRRGPLVAGTETTPFARSSDVAPVTGR